MKISGSLTIRVPILKVVKVQEQTGIDQLPMTAYYVQNNYGIVLWAHGNY